MKVVSLANLGADGHCSMRQRFCHAENNRIYWEMVGLTATFR